jgi:hypothetical protein
MLKDEKKNLKKKEKKSLGEPLKPWVNLLYSQSIKI